VHAVAVLTARLGDVVEKIRIEQHSAGGLVWLSGWLFTIGYMQLTFWQGAAALFVWPYYMGLAAAALLG
jgi:hypothetical protein